MEILERYRKHALGLVSHSIALFAFLSTTVALAEAATGRHGGWKFEQGVEQPSYAVTEPVRTNLNIESVVLRCENSSPVAVGPAARRHGNRKNNGGVL